MHEYEIAVLNLLKKQRSATLPELEAKLGLGKDSILWAIENLASTGTLKIEREYSSVAKLSPEGKKYLSQFPEEKLVEQLNKSGGSLKMQEVKDQIGLIWAKNNGWVSLDKGTLKITESGKEIATGKKKYKYAELLKSLEAGKTSKSIMDNNASEIKTLRNRNLLEIMEKGGIKSIEITDKGKSISVSSENEGVGVLTREMITSGKWKNQKIRKYDINAPTDDAMPARLHPLHEYLDTIRNIWLNMGFTEVSGPIIESAFWNFDALFSPQDHPTRDMQDTFFLKNPSKISIEDIALMKRVKQMHTKGWKAQWREEVAQQAVLRTHATNVSARQINKFANADPKAYPLKFFSVGRVFRNEAVDYKHLAEFYQADGIVIGNNLTFSNLMYTLRQFYSRLGVHAVFKPAYFPFVEPGLEIYYYDEKKKDTIELGGAGIIRKEITKAMGTNKTVLAWGPGLERLTFDVLGIDSITELYRNDLDWLRKRKELKL